MSGSVAVACADRPTRALSPPPAAAPPPEAVVADESVTAVVEKRPPKDDNDGTVVYGYLGKRAIRGRVSPKGAHWSGTFGLVQSQDLVAGMRNSKAFTVAGTATQRETDEEFAEQAPPYGPQPHRYMDCELEVGGAGLTGSLSGSCLEEGNLIQISADLVPPDGRGRFEPFFVRTPERGGDEQDRYYAALVLSADARHACAPLVDVIQVKGLSSGRSAVLYSMRYPCEEQPQPLGFGMGPNTPRVTPQVYAADVTEGDAPKVVSFTRWASLGEPDDPNLLHFDLNPGETVVPGIDLYVATLWDRFQSPVNGAESSSLKNVIWAVTAEGRYGKTVDLPLMESGHVGVCFQTSGYRELYLTDLDGDKQPELVSRTVKEGTEQRGKPGKDGFVPCVQAKPIVEVVAYALDPATLSWTPRPVSKTISEKRLAAGKRIQAF